MVWRGPVQQVEAAPFARRIDRAGEFDGEKNRLSVV